MMMSSKGNMFRATGFCAGNSPMTAGNSPVTGEFPSHRPVTRSFDIFFALRLNKRLSKQSRRRWLRCHRAHYDVTVMWCRIVIQWFGQPWDLSAFNASFLSNFELVKRVKLGGSVHIWKEWPQIWHTALPWLPFLEINYILHSAAV